MIKHGSRNRNPQRVQFYKSHIIDILVHLNKGNDRQIFSDGQFCVFKDMGCQLKKHNTRLTGERLKVKK